MVVIIIIIIIITIIVCINVITCIISSCVCCKLNTIIISIIWSPLLRHSGRREAGEEGRGGLKSCRSCLNIHVMMYSDCRRGRKEGRRKGGRTI